MKKLLLSFFLFFFFAFAAWMNVTAQTFVGGLINTDTTWILAGSPYIVQGTNVAVMSGATLTIDSGVTVKFDSAMAIQVFGDLRAIGTSALPITFTSNDTTPAPGDWGYILFNSSSTPYNFSTGTGSILQYCTIEYAGGANVLFNGAVRLDDAKPYIDNCTIRYNNKQAIKIFNLTGNMFINNCTIQNNTADTGIVYVRGAGTARATITNSTISNNTSTLASSNSFKTGGIFTTVVNMSIKNCVISNNDGNGIMGNKKSSNNDTISNCTITNNSENGLIYYNASALLSNNTFTITDNTVNNNSQNGIYYRWSNSSSFNNNTYTITGNTVNNNSQNGIYYYYYYYPFNNTYVITGNTISNNSQNGIYYSSASFNSNNTFTITGNTVSNNVQNGIYFFSLYSATNSALNNTYAISNNNISSNGLNGFYYFSSSYSVNNTYTISNNIISRNNGSGFYWRANKTGFSTQSPNNLNISKNKIVNNIAATGGGVRIESVQPIGVNTTLTQNVMSENKAASEGGAVYINVVNGISTLTNNTIINNYAWSSSAIYYKSPGDVTANYNTIVYNKTTGAAPTRAVYFEITAPATNPEFRYNNIYNSNCNSPFYEFWLNSFNSDSIIVRNCYWKKNTQSGVDSVIYDFFDNSNLGIVWNSPFDITPNITAPVTPVQNLTKTQVGSDVQLTWTANLESDIAGYNVYWGNPTGYSFSNVIDVGNVTSYTLIGVNVNDTIEVTAYDTQANGVDDQVEGHESWFKGDDPAVFVPIALTASPGNSACEGRMVSFTATGATTYEFFVNGITVQGPGSSNIYTTDSLNNGDSITVTGSNACGTATSFPIVMTVNPLPSATTGAGQSICTGESVQIGASPTGGNTYLWLPATGLSSATAANPTASPAITTTYTLTETITATDCSKSDTVTVTVNPLPVASAGIDQSLCSGQSVAIGSSAIGGNSYSWSPDTGLSADSVANPIASPAATTTYILTVTTIATGCTNKDTVIVTVVQVSLQPFNSACVNAPPVSLTQGFPAGGTYFGTGVSGNNFYPSVADTGTHIIYYTFCNDTVSQTIVVNSEPLVSFASLSDICVDGTSFALTGGSPAGGVFLGNGVSGGMFYPDSAGSGTHTITYTYTDTNGCSSSATDSITVNSLPAVTLSSFSNVCIDMAPFALTGGSPAGGVYSGTGVIGGVFNPATAGAGTYLIIYIYTDTNTCSDSANQNITVDSLPAVTLSSFTQKCEDAPPFTLTGGSPAGGLYSGNGVNGGIFYSDSAGAGTHAITYIYTDTNSCSNSDTQNITVNALPAVTLAAFSDVCIDASPLTLTGGSPSGGVYSGIGVSGGVFSPATAGTGTHSITYTYSDTNNCVDQATQTITVTSLPAVTFSPLSPVCISTPLVPLSGGFPAGGIYSGVGVSSGNFYPSIADTGTHTITYTYTNANNCTNDTTQTITVYYLPAQPIVTANGSITFCQGGSVSLITSTESGAAYQWLLNGSNISGETDTFYIASTAGNYSVEATNICGSSVSDTVTITVSGDTVPIVTLSVFSDVCITTPPFALSGGSPSGGIYSGTGVSSGMFYTDSSGIGTFPITYSYTDSLGCTGETTQPLTVDSGIAVTISSFTDVCINSTALTLSGGIPEGGMYSGTGVSGGIFYPDSAGAGSHIIAYSFSDTSGCTGSASNVITVIPLPTVAFIAIDTSCPNDPPFLLTQGIPAGGTYTGTGVISNTFYPSLAGSGTHNISYLYTDSAGCSDTALQSITVLDEQSPSATISGITKICLGESTLLTATVPQGDTASFQWSTGESTPAIVVFPTETSVYSVTVTGKCGASSTVYAVVNVNTPPYIYAGYDTTIYSGIAALLQATGGISYNWSPASGLICATCASILVSPLENTTYIVTGTDENGCINYDTVTVFVDTEHSIYVGNIFSPNNDGQNDVFFIQGKGIQTLDLKIYNRWGELVFETSDVNNGWDGTRKGQALNADVFVYYLEVGFYGDEQTRTLKGDITLVR